MKTLKLLTLLAFIQCAQPMHAMNQEEDSKVTALVGQFRQLNDDIENYNIALAKLLVDLETKSSEYEHRPQLVATIKTKKEQLPKLETRYTNLQTQAQDPLLSFLTHPLGLLQEIQDKMLDAKQDLPFTKKIVIQEAFLSAIGNNQPWSDRAEKALQVAQNNKTDMHHLNQLKSTCLDEYNCKALDTQISQIAIGTRYLLDVITMAADKLETSELYLQLEQAKNN